MAQLEQLTQTSDVRYLEQLLDLSEKARVFVVWHPSGGTGKTTTALNIGYLLAKDQHRVLVIDLDPRGELSQRLDLTPDYPSLGRCLASGLEESPTAVRVSWTSKRVGMDFWPSTQKGMFAVEQRLVVALDKRNERLRRLIESVVHLYDYILIDCPPGFNLVSINGMVAATDSIGGLVVPVQAKDKAYKALPDMLVNLAGLDRDYRPAILGILPTMAEANPVGRDNVSQVHQEYPGLIFNTFIPNRSSDVSVEGRWLAPVSMYAPSNDAVKAYKQVTRELQERTTITGYLAQQATTKQLLDQYRGKVQEDYDEVRGQEVIERD